MSNEEFRFKINKAKTDNDTMIELFYKYKPTLIKYSTINKIFYEDLYNENIETFIRVVKKFDV